MAVEQPKQTNTPAAQALTEPAIRSEGQPAKSRRWKRWAIGCGGALLVVMLLVALALIRHYSWQTSSVILPRETGRIVFRRKSDHPFLAEYHRRLILEAPSVGRVNAVPTFDDGGGTNMDLYWYSGGASDEPLVRLVDHIGMYVFRRDGTFREYVMDNLTLREVTESLFKEKLGIYLGTFRDGTSGLSFFRSQQYDDLMKEETRHR